MIPSIRRLCAVALLAGALPLHAAAQEKTGKSKFELTAEERTLIDLTNQERKKEKLPALRPSETLVKVARAHSANMARQGKMEHVLDGKTAMQRIKASGYVAAWGGENIAAGEQWPLPDVMQAWMESPEHRKNILKKEYEEIGIGLARAEDGKIYFTRLFATPKKTR